MTRKTTGVLQPITLTHEQIAAAEYEGRIRKERALKKTKAGRKELQAQKEAARAATLTIAEYQKLLREEFGGNSKLVAGRTENDRQERGDRLRRGCEVVATA